MGLESFYTALENIPQFKRGLAFCHKCGRIVEISVANFTIGWPKCCSYTMSLDSPEERAAFKAKDPAQ